MTGSYSRLLSRKQRSYVGLILLVLTVGIGFGQQQGWFDNAAKQLESNQPGLYAIDHFVDGDTIRVNMNGKAETIRFIGVDTPETHKPNTPVQCYGPEAAAFTKATIGKQRVRLSSDPDSTDRDHYDRLLRYVYLPDGTLVNELLIQKGYGFYYPYFPYTKSAQFNRDEQQAITNKIGLWAHCKPIATDNGGYKSNAQGS